MADNQTIFDAPQTVEPEEAGQHVSQDTPLAVEGYEPPPPGDEEFPNASGGGFPFRIIAILAAAVVLIVIVIFFISRFISGGKPKSEVSLSYWGLWENEAVMKSLIDEYTKDNPKLQIKYELQSQTEYRERLQAAIARGEGPDIFRYHNTWVPMLSNELEPIPQDVMKSKDLAETYPPVVSHDVVVNNKYYGVPLMIDGLLLFYNKDLLSEIGKMPPTTWEEFEAVAGALTIKDGFGTIERAGAAIGTAENVEHFSDIIGLLLYQNGTDLNNITSSEAETALTFYTFFAQSPNNVWDANQDNSIAAFAGGKVGMIFAPSWQVFTIKALNPNINFGTAPVPQIAGGDQVAWATYWVEGVSTKSLHQKEAFEFLKFLSSKESLEKLYQSQVASGRSFGEPYPRLDMLDSLKDVEYIDAVSKQVPIMRSWYLSSRTHDNGINDKTISYFKDAVNSMNQGSSAQGALETVGRGVAQVFAEYGLTPK
jgi:multiple sugar transport system substrate-binding protein